jgi:hypothetical protein
MGDVLKFKTEDERTAALAAVEDKPENLGKLEDIRNSEIEAEPSGQAKPEPKPPEGPTPPPTPPAEPKTFTLTDKDLPEGYDTVGKVLKAFGEQRALIERQQNFIKEKLQQSDRSPAEREALARAEKAEHELAEARKAAPSVEKAQPTQSTTADIGTVQTEIKRIEDLQTELEKQLEADPDSAYTADYQKKVAALSRAQTKNLTVLTSLYTKAQSEIADARQSVTKVNESVSKVSETVASVGKRDEQKAAVEAEFAEMDALAAEVPEFKTSKPMKQIDAEYIKYRDDVCLAYYGRPARDLKEKFAAMEQLQLKNADLIAKCNVVGVKTEFAPDIQKYMDVCEVLNYSAGVRKDPATGKLTRLMKYDAETGQQVPVMFPSLKAALQQKRLEEGYYAKQTDAAFQQGAQSAAQAALRRDQGAVELNAGSDQGQNPESDAWAIKVFTEADEEAIMTAHRKGDNTKLDELNKARVKLGMEPITF